MECGNHKKSDVVVTMKRNNTAENNISIQSKYSELFGKNIKNVVNLFVEQNTVRGIDIIVDDYGAWDYVLLARLEACLAGLEDEENDS